MSEPKRGFFTRVLVGLWDTVNFFRRLLFNAIFLLLVVLFFLALGAKAPSMQTNTTLVLPGEGVLVEQYSTDPASRAFERLTGDGVPEVQLRDLLRAIDAARDDERISQIVLRPDALYGAGFAALREVAAALRRFREGGKKVLAYGDYMEQRQYYLAAFADQVYLNPQGFLLLEGLSTYRSYFREGLQDKLGVDVHLFRAGQFKSAGESYVLDAASEEAKTADRFWLGDLWQRYLADIAQARKLDAAKLQAQVDASVANVDAAEGDFARLAQDQGLVDELLREDEFEARVAQSGAADDEKGFRQIDLDGYLNQLDFAALTAEARPQVGVVVAEGEIIEGEQTPGSIGGRSFADLLRTARHNDRLKALVLRVNSPGGTVFASEQIRRELELIRASGKPVVVSMGDVAASGGYWIATAGDVIYADASTITGSIGVWGLLLNFPTTLAKLGVHVDGVATTAIAGGFDPRRPLDSGIGRIIQAGIDRVYEDFLERVAEARKRPREEIDAIAQGRVWSGAQAAERGLIDQLGGLQAAVDDAAKRAGLAAGAYQVRYIEAATSPWERFLLDVSDSARMRAAATLFGLPEPLVAPLGAQIGPLLHSLQRQRGARVQTLAHCGCVL